MAVVGVIPSLFLLLNLSACMGDKAGDTPDDLRDLPADLDGDTFTSDRDCDDEDASVNPDASETCNGVDDDCDGLTDEDDTSTWYADADSDGYGDAAASTIACPQPEGYVAAAGDCDDDNPAINPSGTEVVGDGIDQDCDGVDVEGSCDDADRDGYTSASCGGTDCDDGDDTVHPGADELCDDDVVNDCSGDETGAMAACGLSGTLSLADADLKLIGASARAWAGGSVSGAGDIDGDGLDDLLVGAIGENGGGTNAGTAYLLLGGGALGAAGSPLSLSDADLRLTGEAAGDYAGNSVSGAGDIDGDGLDDLLVGAFGEDLGGSGAGAAYLLLGGGALSVSSTSLSLSDADLKLVGQAANEYAACAVSGAGDVDGDGLDDLLVGTNNYESASAGLAYLLFGGGALSMASSVLALSNADLHLAGEAVYDRAGYSVSEAGDVDGDGLDDLLVGAIFESSGGSFAGAAYLLLGGGALSVSSTSLSLSDADLKLTGRVSYAFAGYSVSGAGDIDGDGLDDLLVGAYYEEASGGPAAGAAYLLLGGGALGGASSVLSLTDADVMLEREAEYDGDGGSVSDAGDVDSDGLDDLLVGSNAEDSGGSYAGAAYLLLGGGALGSAGSRLSLSDADLKLTGEAAYNQAGYSVSGAGDIDGDGFDDLLVGVPGWDEAASARGAAYLVFGGGY